VGTYNAGAVTSINASIPMALGAQTVIVRAWDTSGAYASQTLTLTVGSVPAVAVSAPLPGANVTSPISVQASATPSSGKITGWHIYLDGVSVYQMGVAKQINAHIPASTGTHTLIVRAWDSSGAYGEQTLTVSVTAS
jgi:hypothetical protein